MIIDEKKIFTQLDQNHSRNDKVRFQEILTKARQLEGLDHNDVLTLLAIDDKEMLEQLFISAKWAKEEIYGNRLVLFAPLYVSNLCSNECLYCAFRNANLKIKRCALSQEEIGQQTKSLLDQGHKRVLLVAGESYGNQGLDYILNSIETVYATKSDKGNIRRINVNIAPLTVEEFRRLHSYNIGTYQIFQETYHRETYQKIHLRGPKTDYQNRLLAMDRAFQGGFDDVGVGILFGLADWRFEILALLQHIKHLEKNYGVGPHTISVPRLEPACGSEMSYHPPYSVSDDDFRKIIAVLRLAVPYTGIILSTRETGQMRRQAFELGISQISAGSKTNPGGYGPQEEQSGQFSLGDTRSLHEVIEDIVAAGHIPSFCTGCYRLGRVGADFMDLAKPGLIKAHCLPNGIFTFAEYLHDFADSDLQLKGMDLIERMLEQMKPELAQKTAKQLEAIKQGKRDIYF